METITRERTDLSKLRREIDALDSELLTLFRRRMDAIDAVAGYKRTHGIAIEDSERERGMLSDRRVQEGEYPEYCEMFLKQLIEISKAYQRRGANIYLTGMSAREKRQVMETLSRETGRQGVDLEVIITDRAGMSHDEIVETEGERGLRAREREALYIAAEHGGLVVVTGTRILSGEGNSDLMHTSGKVVFLDTPLSMLMKLDPKDDPEIESRDDITTLYYEQIVGLKSTADLIVDTESPDLVVKVLDFMKGQGL